jgi:hypothetical protein
MRQRLLVRQRELRPRLRPELQRQKLRPERLRRFLWDM